jgi:threonine dehydratase
VMPETTPYVKVARTQLLGATVEMAGETIAEAMVRGHELVDKGLTFVHPYDDPFVIAGQGTVALELLDDFPDLDTLIVPVGGGGLLAGMAIVAGERRRDLELVGVQTEQYNSMQRSLRGDPFPVPGGPTMAEGIAVTHAGHLTAAILKAHGAQVVTVSEQAIEEGVNLFLEIEKVVSEGAGAAGLAALLDHPDRFRGKKVGVVLTGGNIDPRMLASVIMRGLVHTGRLSRLRVWIDDRPGALSHLTAAIGAARGNIVEVAHQRLFADGPIRLTEVELAVETMDRDHAEAVVEQLRAAGYRVIVAPLDPEPPAD